MDADVRPAILEALKVVAPEADPNALDPAVSFRDQLDIDSVDFLNFVLRLEERLGRKIPEIDYPRLSTLDGCVAYLTSAGTAPA